MNNHPSFPATPPAGASGAPHPRRLAPIVLLLASLAAIPARAQTTLVSNLGQSTLGNSGVTLTDRFATAFTTDNSEAGWTLDSVSLLMGTATDTSGNFFAAIYSDGSGEPGSLLETLSGASDPATAATYPYSSVGLNLDPNTTYHMVTGVSSGSGHYGWTNTLSTSETGSWSITNSMNRSTDGGSSWTPLSSIQMFSVAASAIPEPGSVAVGLSAAALGFVLIARRRKQHAVSA